MMNRPIILASQSPRRRHLLSLLAVPFDAVAADADEESITILDPAQNALATAELKINVLLEQREPAAAGIILAADTNVAIGNHILGKPPSAEHAREMLMLLRGKQHAVHTGMILYNSATGRKVSGIHSAEVSFRAYSDAEIEAYIATGDPFDKAGGYAIQHPDFQPMAQLNGCYLGVMGLSLCQLIPLMTEMGIAFQPNLIAIQAAHNGCTCPILPLS